jgi:hypothetical protein
MARYIIDSTRIDKTVDHPNIFDVLIPLDHPFREVQDITLKRLTLPVVWHTIQREVNNQYTVGYWEEDDLGAISFFAGMNYFLPEGWYTGEEQAEVMQRQVNRNPPGLIDTVEITFNSFTLDRVPCNVSGTSDVQPNRDSKIDRWRWNYTVTDDPPVDYIRRTMLGIFTGSTYDNPYHIDEEHIPNIVTWAWPPCWTPWHNIWASGVQGNNDTGGFATSSCEDFYVHHDRVFTKAAVFIDFYEDETDIEFLSAGSGHLPRPFCVVDLPIHHDEIYTWDFEASNAWAIHFSDPCQLLQIRLKVLFFSPSFQRWVEYNPKFMKMDWTLDLEIIDKHQMTYENPLNRF